MSEKLEGIRAPSYFYHPLPWNRKNIHHVQEYQQVQYTRENCIRAIFHAIMKKKQYPIQPQVDGYKVVYKRKLQISERCCQGAALIDTEENCCEYFIQTEGLAKFTVMLIAHHSRAASNISWIAFTRGSEEVTGSQGCDAMRRCDSAYTSPSHCHDKLTLSTELVYRRTSWR